jgi:hypothetical protein
MIDLQPAPVPDLSEEWIASHRAALVEALSQRRRRPMKWAAMAGTAGVAATVSTFVLVGGNEPYAFAGWSASPTTPATGQVGTADAICQAGLAHLGSTNRGVDSSSLAPELSDVRGPYTITVFGDNADNGAAICVSALGATSLRWIGGPDTPVTPGAIAVDQVSLLARDGHPYTLVVGRTGTGVTGVTLALGDGSNVATTSGDGLFVAWWPGSQTITSAAVSTAAGMSTQPLELPGPLSQSSGTKPSPLPPGTQSSTSGAQGSSTVCVIHSCGGTG